MTDEHLDTGAYLLGALTTGETAAFERHLAGCPTCREEIERLRAAADALPRSVEPVDPPASLKRALMRAVADDVGAREAGQRRRSARLRWRIGGLTSRPALGWAGAAAALLVAVAIGFAAGRGGSGAARTITASVDRSRLPHASASLVIPAGSAHGAVLRVAGLPQPPRGKTYEVWVARGGGVHPASLFGVRSGGEGSAGIASSLRGASAVLVTREPARGSDRPSETPVISVRL